MTKRLNFGAHSPGASGLSFEQYVLNALRRIEEWSHDVNATFDAGSTDPIDDGNSILNEDGEFILKETGTGIGLE